jgi:sugar diacid utilization regulator
MEVSGDADELDAPTVASLCSDLGPELLDLVLAPRSLDVRVNEVTVHDPLDPPGAAIAAGDIVLGVGLAGEDDATMALVTAAGRARAAAIVCKRRGEPSSRLAARAQEAEIAVLTTDVDVPWGELYGLIRASLAARDSTGLPRAAGAMSGDLLALADATAKVAGGPVLIEDMRGRVLAFSQDGQEVDPAREVTILRRRVPDEWMRELHRSGVYTRLVERDDVIEVDMFDAQPRRAIAIRAGSQVLGVIWLAGDAATLSPQADEGLREAGQIAALHLMRRQVLDDLDRRVRGGMLRMLLRGDGPAEALLSRLRFAPVGRLLVVAVEADARPTPPGLDERVVNLVVEHLLAYRWRAAATVLDGRVYALIGDREGDDHEGLRRTVEDCLTRCRQTLGERLRAGIGEAVGSAADVAVARRRADQSLDLGDTSQNVVAFAEIHSKAVLADMETFFARQSIVLTPTVAQLVESDRERGTEYVSTLRAYLGALGDAVTAAGRLHIHVNTLRYRIRRIVELIGIDLADPDARLALELQLRVLPDEPAEDPLTRAEPGRGSAPGSRP